MASSVFSCIKMTHITLHSNLQMDKFSKDTSIRQVKSLWIHLASVDRRIDREDETQSMCIGLIFN